MSVITISRETGSGGHHLAEVVAHRLGYELADKSTIGRIVSRYGVGDFSLDMGYVPDFWNRFDVTAPADERNERRAMMVDMLNQSIMALAHLDNIVILGRSGFAVLSDFVDVLNVRIQAPLPIRIQQFMERRKITDPQQAEKLVVESDTTRASFIERFYNTRWDSADAFDLVIDTSKIPETLAVEWMIQAAKELNKQQIYGLHTVNTIKVVPMLASIVYEELHRTQIKA